LLPTQLTKPATSAPNISAAAMAATIHFIIAPLFWGLLDRAQTGRQCLPAMAEEQSQISEMSFEQALRELEGVVRRLESGDVPLDESITLYERGEELRKACQSRLDAAQARIEKIVAGTDGTPAGTQPFDADGNA
tara:strand:+ start:157 stop:561 length:405 start_codon:yes stop_codon:yes gene_type:complete